MARGRRAASANGPLHLRVVAVTALQKVTLEGDFEVP
jgi:hypothetical protein